MEPRRQASKSICQITRIRGARSYDIAGARKKVERHAEPQKATSARRSTLHPSKCRPQEDSRDHIEEDAGSTNQRLPSAVTLKMHGRERDRLSAGGKTNSAMPRQFVKQVARHVSDNPERGQRRQVIVTVALSDSGDGQFSVYLNYLVQWLQSPS